MTEPIIRTEQLTINFGGQAAVDQVSLDVAAHTFTSIIGPNGAGKTTFFNLLSGELQPSGGRIFFKGQDITRLPAHERTRRGLGRTFQITNVFPNLTVRENVRLAVQARAGVHYQILRHHRKYRQFAEKAEDLLESVYLGDKMDLPARALAHGDKRKLEFAIILALEPEVLLLDEPTAGMAVEEVPGILELLGQLKAGGEHTILLVEHKLDMVLSLSDTLVVLVNGRLLATGEPRQIMENDTVQAAYLGGTPL
ncbi:lipopolysaccharide export system ATP-binding protein LptB [Peptococcaceae bacterium CEB3]|nr:lipopolysaccharide export system ATP-binding protein LptB [Peptococcaceae bacterium CEB3]